MDWWFGKVHGAAGESRERCKIVRGTRTTDTRQITSGEARERLSRFGLLN